MTDFSTDPDYVETQGLSIKTADDEKASEDPFDEVAYTKLLASLYPNDEHLAPCPGTALPTRQHGGV